MDTSFDLLSSMSPRINKNSKPVKKAPTKLALKKHFRKSLGIKNTTNLMNESIITISSSSSYSQDENNLNGTPIVISESEISFSVDKSPQKSLLETDNITKRKLSLTKEKLKTIEHWVLDVNHSNDVSKFSEVSTVLGDDNPCFKTPQTNVAASSTFLGGNAKRFDEYFKKNDKNLMKDTGDSENGKDSVITDSLSQDEIEKNLENLSINDSPLLKVDENVSKLPHNGKKKVELEPDQQGNDYADCEDLLDSLYGKSWREKRDEILPSSEPRIKVNKILQRAPNTERPLKKKTNNIHGNNGSSLLKVFQKARFKQALESPWVKSIKRICDSDSDSNHSEPVSTLPSVKLNFDNSEDEETPPKKLETKIPIKTKPIKNKTESQPVNVKSPSNKKYSFLASLSGNIPADNCDFSALIFRNNFQKHKEALTAKLFELYNEKVFDNSLPQNTKFEWNDRLRGTAGKCACKKITRRTGAIERTATITLSKKVLDSADRLRDTLIHELCHAATWIINQVSDGHGPFWKSWANRAMKTFPELPPIKRCHTYVINTKYSYKCTICGYTVGRHTKSLDVETKRCGHCFGKFEVFINKVTKLGETKSVPVTPKKPNAFALFVKENYSSFKTPDFDHGDVMKILSQKFADLKVQNVNKV